MNPNCIATKKQAMQLTSTTNACLSPNLFGPTTTPSYILALSQATYPPDLPKTHKHANSLPKTYLRRNHDTTTAGRSQRGTPEARQLPYPDAEAAN